MALGALGVSALACSRQKEGERCDDNNENEDCEEGLVCKDSQELGGSSDICCPEGNATALACIPNPTTTSTGMGGGGMGGGGMGGGGTGGTGGGGTGGTAGGGMGGTGGGGTGGTAGGGMGGTGGTGGA
jgi:hypothetical protein